MRIAITIGALVLAGALVVLLVLSRDSPPAPHMESRAPTDALPPMTKTPTPAPTPPAPPPPTEEPPQLRAVRASGPADEPWVADATSLAGKLAPGSRTACFVAGCIVELASPAAKPAAERAFQADTTWTGGKQWLGATLILYRPD